MVVQVDDLAGLRDPLRRVHGGFAGLRMDDAEYLGQRPASGVGQRPSGELLGRQVDARDAAGRVSGDHRITDRLQCDRQVLHVVAQLLLGQPARGDVQMRTGHAQRAAICGPLDDHALVEDPHLVAIGMPGANFRLELAALRIQDHLLCEPVELLNVIGVHECVPIFERRCRALRVESEHGHPARIDAQASGRRIPVPLAEVAAAQRKAELLSASVDVLLEGEPQRQVSRQHKS